jgi:uncharacterized tellurite resistance protein B-like protein
MLDLVKRYFSNNNARTSASSTGANSHRILVAACALLLEMAAADGEFSADEQGVILSIIRNEYHVSDSEAAALIDAAQAQRKRSIDLWQFTNLINQNYSEEEKIRVMETVWKVIYADGRLDGHEDYLVHNLADLLRLSHSQLIEAKLRVKRSFEA